MKRFFVAMALGVFLSAGPIDEKDIIDIPSPPVKEKLMTWRWGWWGSRHNIEIDWSSRDDRESIGKLLCEAKWKGKYLAELDYRCL